MDVAIESFDAHRKVVDVGHRRELVVVRPLLVAHLVEMPENDQLKNNAGRDENPALQVLWFRTVFESSSISVSFLETYKIRVTMY